MEFKDENKLDIPIRIIKGRYTSKDITFKSFLTEGEIEDVKECENINYISFEEIVDLAYKNRDLFETLPENYKQKVLNRDSFYIKIPTYKFIIFNHEIECK